MNTSLAPALALPAALMLAACSGESPGNHASPSTPAHLAVAVSIPPQADLVRRIGGDLVATTVFVGPGQDPHHFSPTPGQVMGLEKAAAYFTIGMPFEEQLTADLGKSFPRLRFVEMAEGIDARDEHAHAQGDEDEIEDAPPEAAGDEDDQAPGHDHDHDHDGDPHVWLSVPHLLTLAENTAAALGELDPPNKATYEENLLELSFELAGLEQELLELLEPYQGKAFYIYHPALGHFAENFHLEQKSIETASGNPTPRELMAIVKEAKEHGIKVVFTEPQFDPAGATTVAGAIGGKVVSIDPLAEDVPANLESIARALVDSFDAAP